MKFPIVLIRRKTLDEYKELIVSLHEEAHQLNTKLDHTMDTVVDLKKEVAELIRKSREGAK